MTLPFAARHRRILISRFFGALNSAAPFSMAPEGGWSAATTSPPGVAR
jgi:hypothetical protein